jgi:hypothetical protein
MRWCLSTTGSPEYILHITHSTIVDPSISVHLLYLLDNLFGGHEQENSEMHWEARTEWTKSYTPRQWSSEFVNGIADRDWVNSEINSEAVIELVWRGNLRLTLSEFRDALRGCDWTTLEMHLQAEIEWTQGSSWRPWWIKFGVAPVGRD